MERTRLTLPSALPLLPWLLLIGLAAATSPDIVPDTAGQVSFAGDSCRMKDGSTGICRSIEHCSSAQEKLKIGEQPMICSYDKFTPIVCCPDGTPASGYKAATMCNKYAEGVIVKEENPLSDSQNWKDTCALTAQHDNPYIGGEDVFANEFPHMALLGYNNREQPKWLCGGSLISERYVLIPAHCLHSSEGPPLVVRLGELHLKPENDSNNQHEDYGVAERVFHPDFKFNSYYNDVGLLKLDRDVHFTPSIRPACLNNANEIPENVAIATGWEHVNFADSETSEKLIKVKLPLHTSEVCLRAYPPTSPRLEQGFLDEGMICAGGLSGGKDTCQVRSATFPLDNSGGPLQTRLANPYCMYNIIGITNFGNICGVPNSPGVYTRVSYFLPWIESVVWPT